MFSAGFWLPLISIWTPDWAALGGWHVEEDQDPFSMTRRKEAVNFQIALRWRLLCVLPDGGLYRVSADLGCDHRAVVLMIIAGSSPTRARVTAIRSGWRIIK